MGISLALNEKLLSKREGRVVQTNYDEYKIARMKHTPEIEIEIVESDLPPSGTGEPADCPSNSCNHKCYFCCYRKADP